MSKIITLARLTGGLGNQMFQYAAAATLRERFGGRVKLDLGWFAFTGRESFRLHAFRLDADRAEDCDFALVDDGGWRGGRAWIRGRLRRGLGALGLLSGPAYLRVIAEDDPSNPQLRKLHRGSYQLVGTWQMPSLFADIGVKLRREFELKAPMSARAEEWRQRIAAAPTVAVHVRRGDTVSNPAYASSILSLPSAYYAAAIAVVKAREPDSRFVIFSDEPDWVRDNMPELAGFDFMDDLSLEPHEVLELMKACRHFIIANSTFSWWAGWLRGNDALVVSPNRWFRNDDGGWKNLSVPGWLQIDCR